MDEAEQQEEVVLPINWHFPEGKRSQYANSVVVQVGLYEVALSFFEIQRVDLLDPPVRNNEKPFGSMHAKCVSKIIVRPELVPIMIDILETRPENRLQLEGERVSFDWHSWEGTQSHYANHMIVQSGAYEVVISFFETQLPLLFGSPEESKKQIKKLGLIHAECVSRISIPPEIVLILVNALKNGLESYRQSREH